MGGKASFLQINPQRNYGVDLLRILAMYMVVVLHVLGQGGILYNGSLTGLNYWLAWSLEIASYGAVDIFALISGFVGYKVKHRYANIAELWLKVFLYSVSFTIIYKFTFDPSIGLRKIFLSCFPVTRGGIWYFTMYFALFFLSPVLNAAIEKMTEKSVRRVVIASIILFSIIPFLWAKDTFSTNNGYSLLWLMVLYFVGAYIGKYNIFEKIKKYQALIGYIVCILLICVVKYLLRKYLHSFLGQTIDNSWLVNYTSLPVFGSAVFLLLLFRDIDLPNAAKKVVAVFAPLTFGVFVIHVLPLVNKNFIHEKFGVFTGYSPIVLVLSVLGTAAVIYLACSLIDFIRARLFDLLKIKERFLAIEKKLLPDD
ncbi:MAG: acyltransferase family protein [Clostridia bacterium]|nr:acyltransferase family protein [Clostridia bacterium]